MIKEIVVEIEADRSFCGEKCPWASYGKCLLFGQDRPKNTNLKTLGEYRRLELCRKLTLDN
jgi:hypothetical protein